MTRRVRVMGLPALAAVLVAELSLDLMMRAGVEPLTMKLDWHHPLQFYIPWLACLPVIAAAAAYWSSRQGGTPGEMALAALSPAIAELGLVVFGTILDLIVDVGSGHHTLWGTLSGTGSFSISRVLVPGVALSVGLLAFPSRRDRADSGALWFAVSALGSVGGGWLTERVGRFYTSPTFGGGFTVLLVGLALIFLAGFAAWKLARAGLYSWLLPLAALNLVLLRPGRAGDIATWRLEWGVMGLAWTLAAVLVFARLLRRSDELERRLHLEGAFYGLATGLVAALVYALFETRLPPLRAQWVAVALLLSWWGGFLECARRYRWRA